MATQSGASEIDAARKRLAAAKKWEASARRQAEEAAKNLADASGEVQEAAADLKSAEKKWEVVCLDDDEEETSSPPSKKQKHRASTTPAGGQANGRGVPTPSPSRQTRWASSDMVVKYPFNLGQAPRCLATATSIPLVYATMGMKELNGDLLGFAGAVSNRSTLGAGPLSHTRHDHTLSNGETQTIIFGGDTELLAAGRHLSSRLVDFWMRWISRGEFQQGSNSTVHFFPTGFMSTLDEHGLKAVDHLTSVNPFKKKLLFFPVNKDSHWSLCVVVNPGLVANTFDKKDDEEYAFILFLDSGKKHNEETYAKHIRGWLNFEWQRRGKGAVRGIRAPFREGLERGCVPMRSPKIPYQEIDGDSGLFVCRYAYNLYVMRHQRLGFWADVEETPSFKTLITNGPAFQFDMSDIARIRGEFALLIDRLSGNV